MLATALLLLRDRACTARHIGGSTVDARHGIRFRHCRCAADTPVVRRRAVQYSDQYYTRLTIHRYGSYLMLPLFAA